MPCGQHQCALSMDEMKIKSGLVFNKNAGALSCFVDLGSSNRDIELAISGDGDQDKSPTVQLAEQVFVFMARAVFKPSLSIPIAHYFSATLKGLCVIILLCMHASTSYATIGVLPAFHYPSTGQTIFPLAWEVIESLAM